MDANKVLSTVYAYARSYPQKIKERVPFSVGGVVVSLPINSFLETAVTGMTDLVSAGSRFAGAAFTAVIVPGALDTIEYSRAYFKMDSGWKMIAHDMLFSFCLGGIYKVGAYIASGEYDLFRLTVGTLSTSLGSAVLGPVALGVGSLFQKAYGVTTKDVSRKSKTIKRTIATSLVVASSLATSYIFAKDWPRQQEEREKDRLKKLEVGITPSNNYGAVYVAKEFYQ